eukprot:10604172-Prorocentrum_lima.AAC.1
MDHSRQYRDGVIDSVVLASVAHSHGIPIGMSKGAQQLNTQCDGSAAVLPPACPPSYDGCQSEASA